MEEYCTRSQLQLLRVVDRICDGRKLSWRLVGDIVKNMVLGLNDTTTQKSCNVIDILIVNKGSSETSGLYNLINDLYVMNFINSWERINKNTCVVYTVKGSFNLDQQSVEFNCVFWDGHYPCVLASEQIVLNAFGISLINSDMFMDNLNMNKGFELLQRVIELRSRKDTMMMRYINIPDDIDTRVQNAMMMRKQARVMLDGYKVTGYDILEIDSSDTRECPVCMDYKYYNTTLKCGHAFCVECLSSHIEKDELYSKKCPLCRQKVFLTLINA